MKATLDAEQLRGAATWVARQITERPAGELLTLAGMLLEADDGGTVTLTGFDYTTSRRARVDGVIHTPGRALVGGRLLAAILARTGGDDVRLTHDGWKLVVTSGGLEARLPTMTVEDYPALPGPPAPLGRADADALARAVARVTIAASGDVTMPVLTCVHLDAGASLRLACTDRYRVAWTDLAWEHAAGDDGPRNALVPAHTLADAVKAAIGTVTIHAGPTPEGGLAAGLTWAGREIVTRVLDGTFPPYERIVPPVSDATSTLRADRDALMAALDRVRPATDKAAAARIDAADGHARVSAGGQRGEISDRLPAHLDGPPFTVHVNPAYLRDALTATSGGTAVIIHTASDRLKPLRVSGDDPETYTHAVMPIKIGDEAGT